MSALTISKKYRPHFSQITSDQGSQVTSRVVAELTCLLGSHTIGTTAYHSQVKWLNFILPIALFGLWSVFDENINDTPSEMGYSQGLWVRS